MYENWIQIQIEDGISYSNYLKNTVVAKKKMKISILTEVPLQALLKALPKPYLKCKWFASVRPHNTKPLSLGKIK